MKKRGPVLILAGLAAYAVLLALLLAAERGEPQAGIRSFSDALWYSLVTLTTVGYGDLVPLSPAGRAVGAVFSVLSVGLLAAVFSAAFSFLRSRVVPILRKSVLRRGRCFFFSDMNEASQALARDLIRSEPGACAVFCRAAEDRKPAGPPFHPRRTFCFAEELADILPETESREGRTCFLIGENEAENRDAARRLPQGSAEICCRGRETEGLPGVRFFDAASCAARAYWRKWPLQPEEETVLIAGDGSLARELVSQAVLVNCRIPFRKTTYHLFGDWEEYRRWHPALVKALDGDGDRIVFHGEAWNARPEWPEEADRVIFCGEDSARNAEEANLLVRYFPIRGAVFAAAPAVPPPAVAFGGPEEIFTGENVLRSGLDRRAGMLHDLYCRETGDKRKWDELPPFLKASNRASADHLMTKVRLLLPEKDVRELTPETCREAAEKWKTAPDREPFRHNEHERWMRFFLLYNWRYGPEKNSEKRTHPCLVPYADLPAPEREKDDNAWIQIGMLAGEGAVE